uniref:Uncharacterized protein n=1 Tax=Nelumbo nucifera TaxID=4432 RepID=A0A822YVY5_NELNU|nr:TPA_asm: hypothetical protein HUJ06_006179 [Nelumbo nucifera]
MSRNLHSHSIYQFQTLNSTLVSTVFPYDLLQICNFSKLTRSSLHLNFYLDVCNFNYLG